MHPHLATLAAMFLITAPLVAQASDVVRTAHGVTTHDGVVRGIGPDYSARFDPDGVRFTPVIAGRLAAEQSVRFRWSAVRRGSAAVLVREHDAEPVIDGHQVHYRHGTSLTERYDVRQEGIEQSFVFAERPAGTGDLVVIGELQTNLLLEQAGDDGVRFAAPGGGGVEFGAVTGIDRNGARMKGGLRVIGGALELSLPAAFVERADYPLVLDPMIGNAFSIANDPLPDNNPRVAFDATTGRYLVAWTVGSELRGQRVAANGTLFGNPLLLATASTGEQAVSYFDVANVNASDVFVVAWSRNTYSTFPQVPGVLLSGEVRGRTVSAATGAMSSDVLLASAGVPVRRARAVALGGDSRDAAGSHDVLVVYNYESAPTTSPCVFAKHISVPPTGIQILTTAVPLSNDSTNVLTVSRHAGSAGRWLAAWAPTQAGTTYSLLTQAFDVSGTPCGSTVPVVTGPDGMIGVTCATRDGNHFLLSWVRIGQPIALAVKVQPVVWSGTCGAGGLTPGAVVDLPSTVAFADQPGLDFAKDKYVLVWRERASSTAPGLAYAMGLNPATGAPAGARVALDLAISAQSFPAVAARCSAGDATSDEALLVWSNGAIRGRRWEATAGGTVTSLGGMCGVAGLTDFATYGGTPALGQTFTIELGAPTSLILALVIGFSANPTPCGPCTIVPSVDLLLAGVTPTPVNVPFDPVLLGVELIAQWVQLRPGGCPLLPAFGFSNALKFTIGE